LDQIPENKEKGRMLMKIYFMKRQKARYIADSSFFKINRAFLAADGGTQF
jgi:hypothetical protein